MTNYFPISLLSHIFPLFSHVFPSVISQIFPSYITNQQNCTFTSTILLSCSYPITFPFLPHGGYVFLHKCLKGKPFWVRLPSSPMIFSQDLVHFLEAMPAIMEDPSDPSWLRKSKKKSMGFRWVVWRSLKSIGIFQLAMLPIMGI